MQYFLYLVSNITERRNTEKYQVCTYTQIFFIVQKVEINAGWQTMLSCALILHGMFSLGILNHILDYLVAALHVAELYLLTNIF